MERKTFEHAHITDRWTGLCVHKDDIYCSYLFISSGWCFLKRNPPPTSSTWLSVCLHTHICTHICTHILIYCFPLHTQHTSLFFYKHIFSWLLHSVYCSCLSTSTNCCTAHLTIYTLFMAVIVAITQQKMVHCSKISLRAILLKCFNLMNKANYNLI